MTTDEKSSIASGLATASLRYPEGQTLKFWLALLRGEMYFGGLLDHMRAHPQLSYLTIDTTGVCDLRCPGMCYYHPDIDVRQQHVPIDALARSIADAKEHLNLQSLVFAGKEPLQNMPRLVQLAQFASDLPGEKLSIGLVTNGRAIGKHRVELDALASEGNLSFMDVSIDSGIAVQHDAIRGIHGTQALAMSALKECSQAWTSVRVGSTSVLRNDNANGILELLRSAASFNRHFFITPIQPPPYTTTAPLPWSAIRDFLNQLTDLLQSELKDAGVEVMVSLLGIYLTEAQREGFLAWEDLREDSAGQCYVETSLGSNTLQMHVQVLPETGWRIGRITYTGAYLPNTHFLQVSDPERFAVGYIQERSIVELYEEALSSKGILVEILDSRETHACKGRPCWDHCFGGLVGAEHSYVGGAPLLQQPLLCLRTEKDFQLNHTNSH